jgi:hypothetical protein
MKSIKEDIQMRVAYFLEQQRTDKEAETFKQQKIEMAQIMVDTLSVGLVTPLTFKDVERQVEQLNIAELKEYITNQVNSRKEREEKAAQQALERAEQERIAEVNRLEKVEQARIAEAEKQTKIAEAQERQLQYIADQKAKETNEILENELVGTPTPIELYNAQFVVYGVTDEQITAIVNLIKYKGIKYAVSVKKIEKGGL